MTRAFPRFLAGLGLWAWLAAVSGLAADFSQRADPDGHRFTVCTAHPREDQIGLFLDSDDGLPLRAFPALRARVERDGRHLFFAMNAGMYEPGLSPVGLFVSEGKVAHPLNLRDGDGNFYLKPNGVFFVADGRAAVLDSDAFAREWGGRESGIGLATQSGPLLVHGGAITPKLSPGSVSRLLRNGVATSADGATTWFVIADDPVNLWEMARFCRDIPGCADALYFDGTISSLYAPALDRDDRRAPLGPMIGIVR